MNNIVNLSQLINRLAKITGTDPNTARRFLRTFFATVEEALAEGQTVEIKGIGTFRRCDDPAVGTPGTVGFAPANDFAEEINRPFSVFEPVELADGLTIEELEPAEEEPEQLREEPAEEPITEPVTETAEEPVAEEAQVDTVPLAAEPETEVPAEEHKAPWEIYGKGPYISEEDKEPETIVEPAETGGEPAEEELAAPVTVEEPEESEESDVSETVGTETEEEESDTNHHRHRSHHHRSHHHSYSHRAHRFEEESSHSRKWIWIVAGILAVAGVFGYLAAVLATPIPTYDYYYTETAETPPAATEETPGAPAATAESEAAPEPAAAVETTPQHEAASKEPVYDTVTANRYLAIMAREYYGRSIYWVFIYEANADKLSDPNKVAPGTRVLIPDKESLPGATEEERRAIAEKKQAQILGRYK